MTPDNLINHLPMELLCQVFDQLSLADQTTAMTTCTAWNAILAIDRYVTQRRVNLVELVKAGVDINAVKHYRSFWIGAVSTRNEARMTEELRQFLWSDEVSQRIEELSFENYNRPLSNLFAGERCLCMPELKKLLLNVSYHKVVNLSAPKLQSATILHWGRRWNQHRRVLPMNRVLFVNQLHELKLSFSSRTRACLNYVLGQSFENVRHLSLEGFCKLSRHDLAYLGRLLGQITQLNLRIDSAAIARILPEVLPNAQKLQVLHVLRPAFDVSCLRDLTCLRELYLRRNVFPQETSQDAERPIIVLPNLIKLAATVEEATRFDAPKLQSLELRGRIGEPQQLNPNFPAVFFHNLRVLRLVDVDLSSSDARYIRDSMPQLETLHMTRVIVMSSDVDWLLNSASCIRRVYFENCEDREFYEQLGRRHPGVAIYFRYAELPTGGSRRLFSRMENNMANRLIHNSR